MKTQIYSTLAVLAMLAVTGKAMSQVEISRDGRPDKIFNPAKGLNASDQQFVRNATIANIFEIQSSKLAADRSTNPFVLEYAKEMIEDHQGSLDEINNITAEKGVSVSNVLPWNLQHTLMHLQNLTGSAFDAAYQNAQRAGHSEASNQFQTEIENGKDDDIKAYAVKTLPAIKLHYRMMILKQTAMGPTKMQNNN